ncbi:MAG: hypothetical protein ACYCQI_12950 [Gammaproteobacteria bacterium]
MSTSRRPPRIPPRLTTMDEINRAKKNEKLQQEQKEHEAAMDDLLQGYPDTKTREIYRFEKAIIFDPALDVFLDKPCVFHEMPPTPTDKTLSKPAITPSHKLQANGFFSQAAATGKTPPEQKSVEKTPKSCILQRQNR